MQIPTVLATTTPTVYPESLTRLMSSPEWSNPTPFEDITPPTEYTGGGIAPTTGGPSIGTLPPTIQNITPTVAPTQGGIAPTTGGPSIGTLPPVTGAPMSAARQAQAMPPSIQSLTPTNQNPAFWGEGSQSAQGGLATRGGQGNVLLDPQVPTSEYIRQITRLRSTGTPKDTVAADAIAKGLRQRQHILPRP